DHADRDPDRREDLQLAGHAVGRTHPRHDGVALRRRVDRDVHDRRAQRHPALLPPRGSPADGQPIPPGPPSFTPYPPPPFSGSSPAPPIGGRRSPAASSTSGWDGSSSG